MTMGKLFDKLLNRKKERHPRCAALVPAAGRSERMGGTDKLTAPLCGVPVLLRTLRALDEAALIDEIVVAVSPERLEEIAALCAGANVKTPLRVVEGGGSRTQSVLLAALAAGRIECMAGSGGGPSNARLLAATGVDALHFSARRERESGMRFRNPQVSMGGCAGVPEYTLTDADESVVRQILAELG